MVSWKSKPQIPLENPVIRLKQPIEGALICITSIILSIVGCSYLIIFQATIIVNR